MSFLTLGEYFIKSKKITENPGGGRQSGLNRGGGQLGPTSFIKLTTPHASLARAVPNPFKGSSHIRLKVISNFGGNCSEYILRDFLYKIEGAY